MWLLMTVGMMLPAAFPAVLGAANTRYSVGRRNTAVEAAARFTAGYLTVWSVYCVAAAGLEWTLDGIGVLTHAMTIRSPAACAALLIAVGVYQLSPWKAEALDRCRPAFFCPTAPHNRTSSFESGLRHGLASMNCCGPMMLLTLAVGMMSVTWMAAATAWVLLEKLLRNGHAVARMTGGGLLVWGGAVATGFLT
jgi:predicted metal-binding membrane protein